ncbi:MAG: CcmD family protein [Bacteroidia bacterium]
MKNYLPRFTLITLLMLSSVMMNAQSSLDEKIFTQLRGHASFNVVFIIIAVIFTGLIVTLIRIDRKVARLEKEMKGPKS